MLISLCLIPRLHLDVHFCIPNMIAVRRSEVPSVDHGKTVRVTTDASSCVQLTTKAEY